MRRFALIPLLALAACSQPEASNASDSELVAPTPPPQGSEEAVTDAPSVAEPETSGLPVLEQVWLATGLTAPEGVAYDGDVLYISNVVGEADGKDGEGWISRLAMDGTILEEKWIDGLNAPKGMAVRDDKLFVSDIDAYHVIDIPSAQIENTYPVDGAGFLNDTTLWQGGVYMSDSGSARIFQVDENGYKEWMADDKFGGVNGLTPDGDRLLIATMRDGSLFETMGARDLTLIADGMVNADGIAVLDDGSYLVSSWPGQIWHVSTEGETSVLVDTERDSILQNDLTRIGDLIIVPNWNPGTVTAWRVEE